MSPEINTEWPYKWLWSGIFFMQCRNNVILIQRAFFYKSFIRVSSLNDTVKYNLIRNTIYIKINRQHIQKTDISRIAPRQAKIPWLCQTKPNWFVASINVYPHKKLSSYFNFFLKCCTFRNPAIWLFKRIFGNKIRPKNFTWHGNSNWNSSITITLRSYFSRKFK